MLPLLFVKVWVLLAVVVPVFVVKPLGLLLLYGVNPNADVTWDDVIPVR